MTKIVFPLVAALAALVVSGCILSQAAPKTKPDRVSQSSAHAVPATVEAGFVESALSAVGGGNFAALLAGDKLTPMFYAAAGMVLCGCVASFIVGFKKGVGMMALGILTAFAGVGMIRYPWMILAMILPITLWLLLALRKSGMFEKALPPLVAAVANAEHGGEVTGGIKEQGPEAVAAVRKVVDPIRARMT